MDAERVQKARDVLHGMLMYEMHPTATVMRLRQTVAGALEHLDAALDMTGSKPFDPLANDNPPSGSKPKKRGRPRKKPEEVDFSATDNISGEESA